MGRLQIMNMRKWGDLFIGRMKGSELKRLKPLEW